jgi:hypothetical protein
MDATTNTWNRFCNRMDALKRAQQKIQRKSERMEKALKKYIAGQLEGTANARPR